MAERESRRIAHDLLGEPHVTGHRVSVRQIYALVEGREESPEAVADRFGLDVADVYHALAYYHDHPREMRDVVAERDDGIETVREDLDRPAEAESETV